MAIYSNINTMSRSRMRNANITKQLAKKHANNKSEETYIDMELRMVKERSDKISNAKNPNSSESTLRQLAKSTDESIIHALISNPKLPEDVIYELSKSKNSYIRMYVAESERCPLNLLYRLVEDKDPFVKRTAASNPNFPLEKLFELSKGDEDFLPVLRYIARGENTTREVFKKLLEYGEVVIYDMIRNPICPIDILEELFNSKDEFIKEDAKNALLLRAQSTKTTEEELYILSKIKNISIQLSVGNNPKCPEDLLMTLKDKTLSLFFNKSTKKRIRSIKEKGINSKFKPVRKEELNSDLNLDDIEEDEQFKL